MSKASIIDYIPTTVFAVRLFRKMLITGQIYRDRRPFYLLFFYYIFVI